MIYLNKTKIICLNKKANFEYIITKDVFFSGLVLKGWEVKSLRQKQVNINNAYISFIENDLYLINSVINSLPVVDRYTKINIKRKRKLLLKKKEIKNLSSLVRKKYSFIALSLFWKKNWCKLKFALSKGRKIKDKREEEKKKYWKIEKLRFKKNINKYF